jgi:hypothetical protein
MPDVAQDGLLVFCRICRGVVLDVVSKRIDRIE